MRADVGLIVGTLFGIAIAEISARFPVAGNRKRRRLTIVAPDADLPPGYVLPSTAMIPENVEAIPEGRHLRRARPSLDKPE